MSTLLAIEPPRKAARYAFDDFWMIHVYKCRCCNMETVAVRNSEAAAAMDAHLGVIASTTTVGILTQDI